MHVAGGPTLGVTPAAVLITRPRRWRCAAQPGRWTACCWSASPPNRGKRFRNRPSN